ncbi:Uncharacterised protein [Bordetella pertussis]|nr:Uncharacterised protein [Bordetella pertussis]CFP07867.1 Uncharacterised protein [Bordetella pertussis]CPP25694.1 Uncharacterised protein [Bordetella pertussis]
MDLRQHRLHEEADEGDGLGHRLVARNVRLRPEVLQVEPVAVPEDAGKRHRLPQDPGRQLGSGRPDGAGQRTGHRRARLALGRPGRKARDPRLLPAHHRLRRRTAGPGEHQPAGLARARAPDAGELDRQVRGPALRLPSPHRRRRRQADPGRQAVCVHHPRRHHHGRDVLRGSARAPAGHPCRAVQSGAGRLRRAMQAGRHHRGRDGHARKGRHAHGPDRHPPADRRGNRRLGRQLRADDLRRRRRDGRAGARRARFRLRAQVRPADPPGRRAGRQDLLHRRLAGMVRRQAGRPHRQLRQI